MGAVALMLWLAALSAAPTLRSVGPTGETVAQLAHEGMHRVIVTFKDLEGGQAWATRIADARERVLRAIGGHRFEVNRTYDLIPAVAITVDDAALRILRAHPDVSSVAEDGTTAPGGGSKRPQ